MARTRKPRAPRPRPRPRLRPRGGAAPAPSDAGAPRPGRKRSPDTHRAILEATEALLEERGFAGVNIEAIAARAGVGKQTIYRWWPSRAAIVFEVLEGRARTEIPLPDTGAVGRDLRQFFSASFASLRGRAGSIVRGLMAEAQLDPDVQRQLREAFVEVRRAVARSLLERGQRRRQLPPSADLELMLDLLYGAMWYRLLVGHAPLDDALAERAVALVLRGAGSRR